MCWYRLRLLVVLLIFILEEENLGLADVMEQLHERERKKREGDRWSCRPVTSA
jgi:hypothetical protein